MQIPRTFETAWFKQWPLQDLRYVCPSVVKTERRAGNEAGCSNYDTQATNALPLQ